MPLSPFRQIGRHGSKSVTHKRNAEKGRYYTYPTPGARTCPFPSFVLGSKNSQRTHGPKPVLAGSELGG
jgi:hypothetical protein